MRDYSKNDKGTSFILSAEIAASGHRYEVCIMKPVGNAPIVGWLNDIEMNGVQIVPLPRKRRGVKIPRTVVTSPSGSSLTVKPQIIRLTKDEQLVVETW